MVDEESIKTKVGTFLKVLCEPRCKPLSAFVVNELKIKTINIKIYINYEKGFN